MAWLEGRSNRREYWVYVGLLLALSLIVQGPPVASLVTTAIVVFLQIRRVHDFGRPAWWAVVANLVPLLALPLIAVTSEENTLIASSVILLAMTVGIGVVPGDAGDNRFGRPPPFSWRRVLTGR